MALTPAIAKLNNFSKITTGQTAWCFGTLTFAASDVYTAGGFDIRQLIRKLFGVRDILGIIFLGTSSTSIGTTTFDTSRVLARYTFVPNLNAVAESGKVKLFAIGRTTAGATKASEVELATNDNVRGATGVGLTFPFLAICGGVGATFDSNS